MYRERLLAILEADERGVISRDEEKGVFEQGLQTKAAVHDNDYSVTVLPAV